jgi:hypothetical protein
MTQKKKIYSLLFTEPFHFFMYGSVMQKHRGTFLSCFVVCEMFFDSGPEKDRSPLVTESQMLVLVWKGAA